MNHLEEQLRASRQREREELTPPSGGWQGVQEGLAGGAAVSDTVVEPTTRTSWLWWTCAGVLLLGLGGLLGWWWFSGGAELTPVEIASPRPAVPVEEKARPVAAATLPTEPSAAALADPESVPYEALPDRKEIRGVVRSGSPRPVKLAAFSLTPVSDALPQRKVGALPPLPRLPLQPVRFTTPEQATIATRRTSVGGSPQVTTLPTGPADYLAYAVTELLPATINDGRTLTAKGGIDVPPVVTDFRRLRPAAKWQVHAAANGWVAPAYYINGQNSVFQRTNSLANTTFFVLPQGDILRGEFVRNNQQRHLITNYLFRAGINRQTSWGGMYHATLGYFRGKTSMQQDLTTQLQSGEILTEY
ncbi:MAG: hypothetical protein AAFZ52_19010 [Bacteroidota bacterium]